MNWKNAGFLAISTGMFVLFGCGQSTEPQKKDQSKEETGENAAYITQEMRIDLRRRGFPFHEGANPPKLNAVYQWNDLRSVDESGEVEDGNFCPGALIFAEKDDERKFGYEYSAGEDGTDNTAVEDCNGSGKSTRLKITGDKDSEDEKTCFTAYAEVGGSFDGCFHESVVVTSACKKSTEESSKLTKYWRAFYHKSISDTDVCDRYLEEGRIPSEGELLVVKNNGSLPGFPVDALGDAFGNDAKNDSE